MNAIRQLEAVKPAWLRVVYDTISSMVTSGRLEDMETARPRVTPRRKKFHTGWEPS